MALLVIAGKYQVYRATKATITFAIRGNDVLSHWEWSIVKTVTCSETALSAGTCVSSFDLTSAK